MDTNEQDPSSTNLKVFRRKAWIVTGIVALFGILIWLLISLFPVLLFVLAALLIALFFNGLASLIRRYTKAPRWLALTLSIVVSVGILGLLFWFVGNQAQKQFAELSDYLPSAVETAKAKLQQSAAGRKVVEFINSEKSLTRVRSVSEQVVTGVFSAVGNIYVIIFVAMFFAVSPKIYKRGLVSLVPPSRKEDARNLLGKIAGELTKWIQGKLFAMMVVFILTMIGLYALGIPMPIALAIIAGLLNFVPNFGPVAAMIPAVLVSLPIGNTVALTVAGMYILIQIVESNFITPLVQNKLVKIPPALIILGQVSMGILTGMLGLLLATPIIIIIMKTVQHFYTSDMENS